jgi:hypothetical protein
MLWLSKHARYQKQLSSYVDGQLTAGDKAQLEEHLVDCDACRHEIDELRSAISAVGGLPDVEPPRSFTLTPAMLERGSRTRPVEPVPPVAVGMRLAGAAVAVVLAVVLVGDLGGIGGSMGEDEGAAGGDSTERSMGLAASGQESADDAAAPAATSAAERDAASAPMQADETAAFGAADPCPVTADSTSGGGTGGGTGAGGAGGPVTAATPTAELPVSSPQPTPDASAFAECVPVAADLTTESGATGAAAELRDGDQAEGSQAAASTTDEDGGVSTLTVLEIVLAGALVALLGGIGVELLLRRRRAV